MHEICTLQIGSRANYLATHFWNVQESYFTYGGEQESIVDHDIHFRQGVASDGSDTYTPRTLIYDFKPNFGTLRKVNELYEVLDEIPQHRNPWGRDTLSHRQAPIEQNEYQRSLAQGVEPQRLTADKVRYWSDFNRVFYNPKSIVQLYDSDLSPGQLAFDEWSHGQDIFETLQRDHDSFDEEARPMFEECDQMQGIQLFSSVDDGWAGFSAQYIERLRDELGKTSIWVWALSSTKRDANRVKRLVTEAKALLDISSHASQYLPIVDTPIELPAHMRVNSNSMWETAACQTAGIETILLPSRLRRNDSNFCSLEALSTILNLDGSQKISELSYDVDENSRAKSNGNADSVAGSWSNGLKLFPKSSDALDTGSIQTFARVEVDRAEKDDEAKGDTRTANGSQRDEVRTRRFHERLTFPVLDSFPAIFGPPERTKVVGLRATLSTTSETGRWVSALQSQSSRFVSFDEREWLSNGLHEIREAYEKGDSEEDDWDT